jgi:putative transposase
MCYISQYATLSKERTKRIAKIFVINSILGAKALLMGIPVQYIRLADVINLENEMLKCSFCKHTDHADVNAAFNIAKSTALITSNKKKIIGNGDTDTPMRQRNV